jgi:hypothetical protein
VIPETYVVRIYRRPAGRPQSLIGLVESAGGDGQAPFRTLSEMAAILSEPHLYLRAPDPGGAPASPDPAQPLPKPPA